MKEPPSERPVSSAPLRTVPRGLPVKTQDGSSGTVTPKRVALGSCTGVQGACEGQAAWEQVSQQGETRRSETGVSLQTRGAGVSGHWDWTTGTDAAHRARKGWHVPAGSTMPTSAGLVQRLRQQSARGAQTRHQGTEWNASFRAGSVCSLSHRRQEKSGRAE